MDGRVPPDSAVDPDAPRAPARPTPPDGEALRASVPAVGASFDTRREIERLDRLANLLDARYRIPILGWRFGLDAILGLVPGLGDAVVFVPSLYLVYKGYRLGASRGALAQMVGNATLDFVVGSVPIAGSVFDLFFKANLLNIEILKREIGRRGERAEPRR